MRQLRTHHTNIALFISSDMITYKTSAPPFFNTHDFYFGVIMPRHDKMGQIFPIEIDIIIDGKRKFLIQRFHNIAQLLKAVHLKSHIESQNNIPTNFVGV